MDAQVPLVMALDDPGATPGVAGGKGASLARLARAGFRVPPGISGRFYANVSIAIALETVVGISPRRELSRRKTQLSSSNESIRLIS